MSMYRPTFVQTQRMQKFARDCLRTEKLVEAAVLQAEAAVYTTDAKQVAEATERAVEAFRQHLDEKLGQIKYGLEVYNGRKD